MTGIGLLGSNANLLEANTAVTDPLIGIELGDSNDNRVRRGNVASENRSFGLAVTGVSSDNDLLGNHADGNGSDGIFVDERTSATLILHDRARENSDDGIDIESADATVTENRADHNADLGIEAVPGSPMAAATRRPETESGPVRERRLLALALARWALLAAGRSGRDLEVPRPHRRAHGVALRRGRAGRAEGEAGQRVRGSGLVDRWLAARG